MSSFLIETSFPASLHLRSRIRHQCRITPSFCIPPVAASIPNMSLRCQHSFTDLKPVGNIAWPSSAIEPGSFFDGEAVSSSFSWLDVKKSVTGAGSFLKNPLVVAPSVIGAAACFFLVDKILRRIHEARDPNVPFERTIWWALKEPLQFVTSSFLVSLICRPLITIDESRVISFVQNHAIVLSIVLFLYKLKTYFVRNMLDSLTAKKADLADIVLTKAFSTYASIYLGGFAYYQIIGRPVEYFLIVLFLGVPALLSVSHVRNILLSFLIELWLEDSSTEDSINGPGERSNVDAYHRWYDVLISIPLNSDEVEKFPVISEEIMRMLRLNSQIVLKKHPPFLYLSRGETSDVKLNLECYLKLPADEELISTKDRILLQCYQIIRQC